MRMFWHFGKHLTCVVQITPSGGLIGFKVADDLLTKEYKEDQEQSSHLSGNNKG